MASGERTPLVEVGEPVAPVSWASPAVLGIFYALTGACSLFTVFIRPQVAKTIGSSEEYVSGCQSIFWLGYAAATLLLMPAFDTHGRRAPFLMAGWLGGAALLLSFLTTDARMYGLCQFLIGFFWMPVGNMSFVWASELLPMRFHNNVLTAYNISYSAAGMGMAATSFAMKDSGVSWQCQQALWCVPYVLGLLVTPFVVPESTELVTSAGKAHTRPVEAAESLFSHPVLRQTLATMVCWFAVSTGYYGLSYTSGNLAPDLYLNMGLLSLTDLFCYAFSKPFVDMLGRRRAQMIAFAGAASVLLLCTVQPERSWALMFISLTGRLCLAVAFSTVYLLLADFPVSLRASACGAANVTARLGCAYAPLLVNANPSVVCAGLSVAALAASVATWSLQEKLEK